MKDPEQPETMRTKRGTRITARRGRDGVCLFIFGIEVDMTGDESHQLRDLLHAAELAAKRQEGNDDG
jgi:hypothetical protein